MITLMIVDDEAVIRQGLRKALDWEEYGIAIACEAKNGTSALEKARQYHPDIVISDIRMPDGDGILLAKNLLEIFPHIKIIMLSGYSDIEYMMEAIKLGIHDYLLKPAGTDKIRQSVLKLRDEILLERKKEEQSSRLEYLVNENMDMLKSHFLNALLTGKESFERIEEKARALQIDLSGSAFSLFVSAPRPEKNWEFVQMITSNLQEYFPVLVSSEDGTLTTILKLDAKKDWRENLLPVLKNIAEHEIPPTLSCLSDAGPPEEFPILYRSCIDTLARSIWFDEPLLFAEKNVWFEPLPEKDFLACERRIIQNVDTYKPLSLEKELDCFFSLLRSSKPENEIFKEMILELARTLRVFSEKNELLPYLEDVFQAPFTVEQIQENMISFLHNPYSQYGAQVKKALLFMEKNCTSNLSLSDVASALYISPSYLTRLLKNKTGQGFNDWLHIHRINKAKDLLVKSDKKHYEIAEETGYRSYKIFSEYFSKIAGCSAREFREKREG